TAVGLLAPLAPGLGAEPVDSGGARDATEPGARRAATRVEAPPAPERPLECLRREILCCRAVACEVHEIAVDGVEMLRDDFSEGRGADATRRPDRCRERVHVRHTAPTPGTVTPER